MASHEVSVGFRSAFSADFSLPSTSQPAKSVTAVLVAELDVPGPAHVLAAKNLAVVSGFVRLRTSVNHLTLASSKVRQDNGDSH